MNIYEVQTRREVAGTISRYTLGLFSTAIVAACGRSLPTTTQPPKSDGLQLPDVPTPARTELFAAINELPPSSIKTDVQNVIVNYYRGPYPKKIPVGDSSIIVRNATVSIEPTKTAFISGTVNMRANTAGPVEELFPLQDEEFKVPYGLYTAQEQQALTREGIIASDGSPLIIFQFPHDKRFYQGVSPHIRISRPETVTYVKKTVAIQQFILIKEACTLAMVHWYTDYLARKAQQLCLSIHMVARNGTGQVKTAEALSEIINLMGSTNGRFNAIMDGAGLFIATKAVEERPDMIAVLTQDPLVPASFLPSVRAVPTGQTSEFLMQQAIQWGMQYPDFDKLQINHNRQTLP